MLNYLFCPYCKSELKVHKDFYECPRCQKNIYKHSSITASIYPVKNGQVLLSIRAISPQKGKADAIGGFLRYGEHPLKGITREVKEETGLKIKAICLLGIYMDTHTYQTITRKTLNFFYVGKILSGKMKATDDVQKLFWQPINKPPQNFAFKCFRNSYLDLQKWYRNYGRGAGN